MAISPISPRPSSQSPHESFDASSFTLDVPTDSTEVFFSPAASESANESSFQSAAEHTPTNHRSSQFFTPGSSQNGSLSPAPASMAPRRLFAADGSPEDPSKRASLSAMSAEDALEMAARTFQNAWNGTHTSINFMGLMNTLRMVRTALEAHPQCDGLWSLKAECQYASGDYSEAAGSAATALELNPRNAAAHALVQQCAAKTAVELPKLNRLNLSGADESFMDFAQTILMQDTLAKAQAEAASLLKMATPLIEIDPDDATWLSTKILCLIIRGEVGDFVEIFHRTEPKHVMETVNVLMHALTAVEENLQKNPHHLPSLVLKTGCLALKGQYEQSMATPNNNESQVLNESAEKLLEQLAVDQNHYLKKAHEETVAAAEELLRLDPNNLTGIFMKAQALLFQGNKEQALEMANTALLIYPSNELLWVLLAKCLFPENLEKAIESVEKALRLNPKNLVSWGILLQCRCKAEDTESAVATVLQADEYFPNHPMLQEILERCLPVENA